MPVVSVVSQDTDASIMDSVVTRSKPDADHFGPVLKILLTCVVLRVVPDYIVYLHIA